jgi:hypothetical protein
MMLKRGLSKVQVTAHYGKQTKFDIRLMLLLQLRLAHETEIRSICVIFLFMFPQVSSLALNYSAALVTCHFLSKQLLVLIVDLDCI